MPATIKSQDLNRGEDESEYEVLTQSTPPNIKSLDVAAASLSRGGFQSVAARPKRTRI